MVPSLVMEVPEPHANDKLPLGVMTRCTVARIHSLVWEERRGAFLHVR